MSQVNIFDRTYQLSRLSEATNWDLIIIGGGATGLGIAVDAASRGYKTLLLEQSDFAKGTSSRSTKLVHGGVRYLASGQLKLVRNALKERGILLKNAPHLVKKQPFIVPCYSIWEKIKYLSGLMMYDLLSGKFSFGRSRFVNRDEMLKLMPGINEHGLLGGVLYYDGQFDDARLAVSLARTAINYRGVLLNYFKVTQLLKAEGKVSGVIAIDQETRREYRLSSKSVINATGVFVDDILKMDEPGLSPLVRSSQGVHLMMSQKFNDGDYALMIPKTPDGRVIFAVPWQGELLVGTTDVPVEQHSLEPRSTELEIDYILETISRYFSLPPKRSDILSVFAGLRPLVVHGKNQSLTKEISRDHKLTIHASGLITITGGKWTTYRKMAEDTVNNAIRSAKLEWKNCITEHLKIHGYKEDAYEGTFAGYGTDAEVLNQLILSDPGLSRLLVRDFPFMEVQVVWAARYEMARTVEDVLSRRLRLLILDARSALKAAPKVADILADELGFDEDWKKLQLSAFKDLANRYLLTPYQYHEEIAGNH